MSGRFLIVITIKCAEELAIGTVWRNSQPISSAVKDKIWGIELFMKDENCYNQNMCKGQNLLGYTLTMVCKQFY